jgi:NAD(P)-dependent dehydrogenase (short-subunit alcohol dehydrogenase family)
MDASDGSLAGKSVVVTGAGGGLGRAYALLAAHEGAAVVVNDVDGAAAEATVSAIEAAGGTAVVSVGSVAEPGTAGGIIATCTREFGRIDGLVNNAGVFFDALPWDETIDDVRQMVEVNLLGTIFCGRAALEQMRRQKSGVVVNITSGAAHGMRGMATYGATKGAVASLALSWALDAAGDNVRVFCVSPTARTGMRSRLHQSSAFEGRDPATVAPIVCYLLSDHTRGITGQIVRVAGTVVTLVRPVRVGDVSVDLPRSDVASVVDAFESKLVTGLEPVGLELRSPQLD